MSVEALEAFVGEMTVAELCARTGHRVDELIGFCFARGAVAAPSSAGVTTRGGSRGRARSDGLDEQVMTQIAGAPDGLGGRDLANATGATLPQIRAALKRLVDAKRVRFEGQTSARRYRTR